MPQPELAAFGHSLATAGPSYTSRWTGPAPCSGHSTGLGPASRTTPPHTHCCLVWPGHQTENEAAGSWARASSLLGPGPGHLRKQKRGLGPQEPSPESSSVDCLAARAITAQARQQTDPGGCVQVELRGESTGARGRGFREGREKAGLGAGDWGSAQSGASVDSGRLCPRCQSALILGNAPVPFPCTFGGSRKFLRVWPGLGRAHPVLVALACSFWLPGCPRPAVCGCPNGEGSPWKRAVLRG